MAALEAEMKVARSCEEQELERANASLERMTAALTGAPKEKSSVPKHPRNGADKSETVAE
ncbi:hypothetical protein [Bradyrhizobium sp. WSM471]|uniref:hypothetical protein n=1 Tax=Bradyrhizobium sp. WSM471 TaxID=319017 RepID=UPI00024D1AB9|nr:MULTISPECIES: hypothetical protein [Bradyrhizobium]EHR00196.1 hypothetical protein Bra471DRAFT_00742 [Bradyrhizobium sp. WSM471]UFW42317.1 hypothetical protein BcanWSM471_03655 [Bradyrhizobium canariense]